MGGDMKEPATWGDVFWSYVRRGYPREEAAFRADEWEKRKEIERFGFPPNRKARRAAKSGKKEGADA